jgi:hypothetical protein
MNKKTSKKCTHENEGFGSYKPVATFIRQELDEHDYNYRILMDDDEVTAIGFQLRGERIGMEVFIEINDAKSFFRVVAFFDMNFPVERNVTLLTKINKINNMSNGATLYLEEEKNILTSSMLVNVDHMAINSEILFCALSDCTNSIESNVTDLLQAAYSKNFEDMIQDISTESLIMPADDDDTDDEN